MKSPEFKRLLKMLRNGDKIMIIDFDGPKIDNYP